VQEKKTNYVILSAVSFDDTGDLALNEGARSARQHVGATLHVVHVVSTPGGSPQVPADEPQVHGMLAEAQIQLRTRVEALESAEAIQVFGHVRPGTPVRGILQVAADIDADLIVVGTHKRMGVRKFMLGSVAERVLRDAHCPVLVAMPKNHARVAQEGLIEPPCPECLDIRTQTTDTGRWCERHSRATMRAHVYEPSDPRRAPAFT
jgi:nucleotide-binding universal stress UspA family protein